MTDPQALAEQLIGHNVRIRLTTGEKRTGVLIGCGPSGLQLASGIGGRMLYRYGDIDKVDDLGELSPN